MKKIVDIANLKEEFVNQRGIELTDEEFTILVLTYPAFLVAISDGVFDNVEKQLMSEVIRNFLFQTFGNELTESEYLNITLAYLEDFEFLNINKGVWKSKFLNALSFLKQEEYKDVRASIIKLVQDIAEVSEGTSKEEENVINEIINSYL